MENRTLPSGKVLNITMASFQDGHKLLKVVAKEIEGVRFSGDVFKEPEAIKNLLMRAIYSSDVEEALKPCLARCSYDKKQITDELFENEKVRGDYLPIVKEVLIYNLTPFLSNLNLLLKDIKGVERGQP